MRFVVEGTGAFTAVEGEKTTMHPGDFIITPSWTFHDHGNPGGPLHACHGVKMRYVNPATGGYPMPTIGAFIQYLPHGFAGTSYRATDATVYSIVEGKGRTTVGDLTFEWGPRDIFAIPSWAPVRHTADSDAVLFSMSDRPAQIALGLWREEAPIAGAS